MIILVQCIITPWREHVLRKPGRDRSHPTAKKALFGGGVDFCVCGGYTIGVDNVYRPNAICLLLEPGYPQALFCCGRHYAWQSLLRLRGKNKGYR